MEGGSPGAPKVPGIGGKGTGGGMDTGGTCADELRCTIIDPLYLL